MGCLRSCDPSLLQFTRQSKLPPAWFCLGFFFACLGFGYLTTRFSGPQPDPVSGPSPPSYGCGAVWPECLQLDAVCQVAALHCPDLFGLLPFMPSVHVTHHPQEKNLQPAPTGPVTADVNALPQAGYSTACSMRQSASCTASVLLFMAAISGCRP